MVAYQIISDEFPIGNYTNREDAEKALMKYVDNGYIKEV